MLFLLLGGVLIFSIALLFTYLIPRPGFRGRKAFSNFFYFPNMISQAALAVLWVFFFNPEFGLLNMVLEAIGLGEWCIPWLGSRMSEMCIRDSGETVRVLKNAESAGAALAGKEVTLDLAGCEVALRGPLVAGEGAHLIIEDSADATEGKPTVSKDNKVTYDAGRLYAAADAGMSYVAASAFGGSITLKSGIVDGLNADSFAPVSYTHLTSLCRAFAPACSM